MFDNYRQSMRNLASYGVTTVCYNFMPVLDWTRTELALLPGGGNALRFNADEVAAFDCYMLERDGAETDYTPTSSTTRVLVCQRQRRRQAPASRHHHGRAARGLRPL